MKYVGFTSTPSNLSEVRSVTEYLSRWITYVWVYGDRFLLRDYLQNITLQIGTYYHLASNTKSFELLVTYNVGQHDPK